jgi:adenosylcobinamide-GDP ribazoletransferase
MPARTRLADGARHFLIALQFLTRVPVRGALAQWTDFSPQRLRASAAHFPGVGLFVGASAALVFAVVSILLPPTAATPFVAAVLSSAFTLLLTGAFHEDGLADLADGLGGSGERERALAIMKDSRIGSFGALAIASAMAGKVALLAVTAAVSPTLVLLAIVAGHSVSRMAPLLLIRALPHVGDADGSKSKPLADSVDRTALATGAAWCAPVLLLLGWVQGPAVAFGALLAAALAYRAMHALLARRLGGFTGDGLGATQQVTEIAFYFGAAAAWQP